jgi:phytoene synthase
VENELPNASSPIESWGEGFPLINRIWSRSRSAAGTAPAARPSGWALGVMTPELPDPALAPAYAACRAIIQAYSRSFYLSARLLPAPKCTAVLALYAFCRQSDNIVDDAAARGIPPATAAAALDAWAAQTRSLAPTAGDPVVQAWADVRRRFAIPQALADELLAGVRMDLWHSRYATWGDLWIYCYRVASTVGLMSTYITGAVDRAAINYAIRLGVALQLTNILRDVGEDARVGRIYLPLEDLARFGVAPRDLLAGRMGDGFRALMRFQVARARRLYDAAWPGIALLAPDSRLGVATAATVYRGILDKIEAADYDVFSRRAHLSGGEKLSLLPGVWWRVRGMRNEQ